MESVRVRLREIILLIRRLTTLALSTRIRAEQAYYDMQSITDKLYAQSNNGNNFYKLYDLIIKDDNILLAYRNIKKNSGSKTKGTDGKTVQDYANLTVEDLVNTVRKRIGNYQPNSIRRVNIPKTNGKIRPLGIPTFEDRLIQQCIKQILEPICEAKFHPHSYGFRPLRSTKYAISRMMTLAQVKDYQYCVDIDIKGFFDNVNHGKLIKQMWTMGIRDKRIISIISKMLKAEIYGEGVPVKGVPQGGILSPLLSNIVLNELDWWISSQYETVTFGNGSCNAHSISTLKSKTNLKKVHIVRYADDFKIMCKTHNDATSISNATKAWLAERLKLETAEDKTKITNLQKQFSEFLGFKIKVIPKRKKHIIKSHMTNKSMKNAKEMLTRTIKKFNTENSDKTRLLNKLNSQIMGLHQYYSSATMVNHDFSDLAYKLKHLIENRLKPIAQVGKFKTCNSRYITETYLRKNNYTTYKIKNNVLIPMVYISHKRLLNFTQSLTVYSELGRNAIGYKRLILEEALKRQWKTRNRYDTTELVDNSISVMSAQMLKCKITGLFVTDGQIHHKIPRELGGSDEYGNLVYVHKFIHNLIHLKDASKIQGYLKFFSFIIKSEKQMTEILRKLNEYREQAGNDLI